MYLAIINKLNINMCNIQQKIAQKIGRIIWKTHNKENLNYLKKVLLE
jgi:hypothetical protein